MEFRADTDAVRIHGTRDGLSNALKKINSANSHSHYKASKVQESGANLFIENPFTGDRLTKYFSTHPPLDDRLKNIKSSSPR
jgi:heat shock protein HtpX